jgi:hypothetical protein
MPCGLFTLFEPEALRIKTQRENKALVFQGIEFPDLFSELFFVKTCNICDKI